MRSIRSEQACATAPGVRRDGALEAAAPHQQDLVEANAVYRIGDADAMAKAEAVVKKHIADHADIMAVPAAERQAAHARF